MTVLVVLMTLFVSACMEARAPAVTIPYDHPVLAMPAPKLTRVSGADMPETTRFGVHGTDLGIPVDLGNGNVAYIFGDTFEDANSNGIHGGKGWRSPVLLRSNQKPIPGKPIRFDSAAGLNGEGIAPEIMPNGHRSNGEFTVIPTDGISFPETGEMIVSYMSVREWTEPGGDPAWKTNHAGLAWSPDGNHFQRIGPIWPETPASDSPFQTWSMQRDGEFVYVISVQAGRRPGGSGPMLLQRVHWDKMLDATQYQCWSGDGTWGSDCKPIIEGSFGEPSLRLLRDGTWAMSYLDVDYPDRPIIVTRTADSPQGPWSEPKVQITWKELPQLYGGFIHPYSTRNSLVLMVSTYQPHKRYDVSFYTGTL